MYGSYGVIPETARKQIIILQAYWWIREEIPAYLEMVLRYMPDYKDEPKGIEELKPWFDMIQQRCRIKAKSCSGSSLL